MDICLEPDVVLFHLKHILGQNISISDEQLGAFTRDLRKLIKRDQRRLRKEGKENSSVSSSTDGAVDLQVKLCKCHTGCRSSYDTSSVISEDSRSSDQSSCSNSTGVKKPENVVKPPALSFIKPWRLKPPPKGSQVAGKSDPVNLFQQYQEQWKQVHVPGESGLTRLRWSVRERMLGQDPEPRGSEDWKENDGEPQKCPCICCNAVPNELTDNFNQCPRIDNKVSLREKYYDSNSNVPSEESNPDGNERTIIERENSSKYLSKTGFIESNIHGEESKSKEAENYNFEVGHSRNVCRCCHDGMDSYGSYHQGGQCTNIELENSLKNETNDGPFKTTISGEQTRETKNNRFEPDYDGNLCTCCHCQPSFNRKSETKPLKREKHENGMPVGTVNVKVPKNYGQFTEDRFDLIGVDMFARRLLRSYATGMNDTWTIEKQNRLAKLPQLREGVARGHNMKSQVKRRRRISQRAVPVPT